MLDWFLVIIAFVGSFIAGVIDLKTTEIPDQIPYIMAAIGVISCVIQAIVSNSFSPVLYSFTAGIGFLAFGIFMYYTGQWGGGDAKLLSALGFLLGNVSVNEKLFFPLPLSLFFNVFFIGAIYMILYAIVLTFMNKKIWFEFLHQIKSNTKMLVLLNITIAFILILFGILSMNFLVGLNFMELVFIEVKLVFIVVFLFFVWRFSKTVEDVGFKRKIPVSELKEGDVLLDSKLWEGLTKEQVKEIKKSGKKHVWIKEGVRFGMAFPLALLFTIFVGDGLILLARII
ncbi:MAG: A24 family peptidase [Candidatus Aenigmatarchaeota archaeon]|nr:A24 family peptidase [Candidatus Aenigmarchaeota archaeon]